MVNISLFGDDEFDMTVNEVAAKVLVACGGDPEKDSCSVSVQPPVGQAGYVPPPPAA